MSRSKHKKLSCFELVKRDDPTLAKIFKTPEEANEFFFSQNSETNIPTEIKTNIPAKKESLWRWGPSFGVNATLKLPKDFLLKAEVLHTIFPEKKIIDDVKLEKKGHTTFTIGIGKRFG